MCLPYIKILVFIFKKNCDLLDTIIDFDSFKVNFIAVRKKPRPEHSAFYVSSCCDCKPSTISLKKKKKNNNYFIDITLNKSFRLSYFNLVI